MNVSNFRRVISSFTLHRQGGVSSQQQDIKDTSKSDDTSREIWYFQIEGQAFLWHQVRCMVALLFLIGKNLEHVDIIKTMLSIESTPRKPQVI